MYGTFSKRPTTLTYEYQDLPTLLGSNLWVPLWIPQTPKSINTATAGIELTILCPEYLMVTAKSEIVNLLSGYELPGWTILVPAAELTKQMIH